MRCVYINLRKAAVILLSLLINSVQHTHMADNDLHTKDQTIKNSTHSNVEVEMVRADLMDASHLLNCPTNTDCDKLDPHDCYNCRFNYSCIYGKETPVTCFVKPRITCKGPQNFTKTITCRYCYQTDPWEHSCILKANCNSIATTRSPYVTNCTVHDDIFCLGSRTFSKNILCNWTGGYRWSTALILSITLGGFGADRFYLGHWQEGIGKLFSFGGLGVWTLIDVILISLHYLGPADGSLYI